MIAVKEEWFGFGRDEELLVILNKFTTSEKQNYT